MTKLPIRKDAKKVPLWVHRPTRDKANELASRWNVTQRQAVTFLIEMAVESGLSPASLTAKLNSHPASGSQETQ